MRILFLALLVGLTAQTVQAKLVGEEVTYSAEGTELKGYVAYDDALEGERPGVLVIHEWWGHNDYARKRADMLAELGYVALAVDMYGDGQTAQHPDEAGAFAQQVSQKMSTVGQARFLAALEVLKNRQRVTPDQIAAVGYCFGGGVVLQMARYGLDLDAVVSFHGSLSTSTPAQPGEVKADILVLTGGQDGMVPPEQVEAFQQEMTAADVDHEVVVYPEAKHSFTNPKADEVAEEFGLPLAYDEAADRQSWEKMKTFLAAVFESSSSEQHEQ